MTQQGPGEQLLAEAQFIEVLADYFSIGVAIETTSELVRDLGFDSLQRLELLLFLEELGHHAIPDEVQSRLRSVSDVYELYVLYSGHQ